MNKIDYVPTPQFMEYKLMGNQEEFVKRVVNAGKIQVKVSNQTKTRLRVFMYLQGDGFNANWEMEGFKTHASTEMNYFTYKNVTSHYFKVMKAQKLPQLEQYITAIVNKLFGNVDIEIFNNNTIRSLV